MKSNTLHIKPFCGARISTTQTELVRSSPSNQNEPHIHRETELYVNLSGDIAFEVENRIYPISRGSVIIAKPYEYHRCIYLSDEPHKHWWVLIDSDGEDELSLPILTSQGNHIRLGEEALLKLTEQLRLLTEKNLSPLNANIAYLSLISLLSEENSIPSTDPSSQLSPDVLLALRYMDEHIAEHIELPTLARAAFVSVNTLERHFKGSLNMTPSAMLKRKRLIYSTRFLRDGASVSEACEKSGFTDYSGYINAFRLFFGMTPLKYKKTLTQ